MCRFDGNDGEGEEGGVGTCGSASEALLGNGWFDGIAAFLEGDCASV